MNKKVLIGVLVAVIVAAGAAVYFAKPDLFQGSAFKIAKLDSTSGVKRPSAIDDKIPKLAPAAFCGNTWAPVLTSDFIGFDVLEQSLKLTQGNIGDVVSVLRDGCDLKFMYKNDDYLQTYTCSEVDYVANSIQCSSNVYGTRLGNDLAAGGTLEGVMLMLNGQLRGEDASLVAEVYNTDNVATAFIPGPIAGDFAGKNKQLIIYAKK